MSSFIISLVAIHLSERPGMSNQPKQSLRHPSDKIYRVFTRHILSKSCSDIWLASCRSPWCPDFYWSNLGDDCYTCLLCYKSYTIIGFWNSITYNGNTLLLCYSGQHSVSTVCCLTNQLWNIICLCSTAQFCSLNCIFKYFKFKIQNGLCPMGLRTWTHPWWLERWFSRTFPWWWG